MKKFLPVFCLGGLIAAACLFPTDRAHADVKAGVDAWSVGDCNAAVKEWTPLAERGDPDAQFNLAQAYRLGRGVRTDLAKAEVLFRKAAAQGHIQAADNYGLLLFQEGERQKAMPYVQAAASRGDPRAQYILGVAYFNGDLVAKDWVRGYALVSLAGQAGLPQAAHALAQMDQHIPLADRQKSVALSSQIAAEAQAARTRESAAAELGSAQPGITSNSAKIVSDEYAVAEAPRPAGDRGPANAGADYARPTPAASRPAPIASAKTTPTNMAPAKPAPVPAKSPAVVATSGPWSVQLGAFGVAGNAEALWSKVKGRPELAGHGKVLTPAGKLTKLKVTGFATREATEAACARLSAGGFTCIPVRD